MKPKLNLDKKKLLENAFARSLHGYNPDEVDRFLDKVIEDYESYEQAVTELSAAVASLKAELEAKKGELSSVNAMYVELKERTPTESQLSLLQKSGDISRLTAEVQRLVDAMKAPKPKGE